FAEPFHFPPSNFASESCHKPQSNCICDDSDERSGHG
ncbi:MAG: hypothetical protein ACI82A_003283, partial [Candidatus Azotimanducaceae bacterium]